MKKIGFMGMGIMGLPMATNLMNKSGCDVIGFDVVEAARERFEAQGGKATGNADEIYADCEVIFLCLPKNELVDSTVREIIKKAKAGNDYRRFQFHCSRGLSEPCSPWQKKREWNCWILPSAAVKQVPLPAHW